MLTSGAELPHVKEYQNSQECPPVLGRYTPPEHPPPPMMVAVTSVISVTRLAV